MAKRSNGEGSIYKRKDGRWCGAYYDENYKRHYIYAKTQKEVKQLLKEKQNHYYTDAANVSLQDWVNIYLEKYKRNEIKETTYGTYIQYVGKHICGTPLGKKRLSDITSNMLQNFYNQKKEEGYNPKTIRHIAVIVNGAMDKAYKLRMIPENPNSYTTLPKRVPFEASYMSKEEVDKLVKESKDDPLYPIVILTLFTGMRKGEVMALKWSNINFDEKILSIEGSLSRIYSEPDEKGHRHATYTILDPKSKKSRRRIPLTKIAIEALEIQRHRQNMDKIKHGEVYIDNGLVFCDEMGGYYNQRRFMNEYHEYLKKYGVSDIRFHDLRHSFASLLLLSGVSIKVIQELMGHSSIALSMDLYTHLAEELKYKSIKEFEDFMSDNSVE